MPTIERDDIDEEPDYVIQNNTESDYVFPYVEKEEKTILQKKAVDGAVTDVETTVEKKVARRQIHLPPTFDRTNPGQVGVLEEEMEQLRENTNFTKMVDDHLFNVQRA